MHKHCKSKTGTHQQFPGGSSGSRRTFVLAIGLKKTRLRLAYPDDHLINRRYCERSTMDEPDDRHVQFGTSTVERQPQQRHDRTSPAPPRAGGGGGGLISNVIGRAANPVLAAVDVDAIIQRVDVNELVAKVDWNAVVDEIDWNNLLDHIDLDALIDKIDVDRAVERVDVNALIERSNLKQILARSSK